VAGVVDVVGLGRREQHPVGPGREQAGQDRVAAGPEGEEHPVEGLFQLHQRRRAGVDGGEHVDQHDLAVDALEMLAEEGAHDAGLVGFEAPFHQRAEASGGNRRARGEIQGGEGEGRRAREVARHQETAGRGGRHRLRAGAKGGKVALEGIGAPRGRELVRRAGRVEKARVPGRSNRLPVRPAARRDGAARPFGVIRVEEREVGEPLARVVDDVDGERRGARAPAAAALVLHVDAQLADGGGGARPAPLGDDGLEVLLEGEAGHVVVRLMRQPGAADAPFRGGAEGGKRRALEKMVNQRRREHRLARARQAGDAEPHRRLDELARRLP
jgi:hypothetical protein